MFELKLIAKTQCLQLVKNGRLYFCLNLYSAKLQPLSSVQDLLEYLSNRPGQNTAINGNETTNLGRLFRQFFPQKNSWVDDHGEEKVSKRQHFRAWFIRLQKFLIWPTSLDFSRIGEVLETLAK
jgi:hypothetical protein